MWRVSAACSFPFWEVCFCVSVTLILVTCCGHPWEGLGVGPVEVRVSAQELVVSLMSRPLHGSNYIRNASGAQNLWLSNEQTVSTSQMEAYSKRLSLGLRVSRLGAGGCVQGG